MLHTRVVTGAGGGPDKTILNSPRFLNGLGYRAFCAYMHAPADAGFETLQAKARLCGAPLISVPDRGPFDTRVVTNLLKICREKRVGIWHGHDYKSNLLGLLIRPFWPMRLVTTVHGWVERTWRTPLYYAVDRLCLPQYDRVICVSNDLYEQCLVSGVSRDRCLLIENAIDTDEYCLSATAGAAKAERGLRPGRFTIGAMGRLSAEKGFDILIEAFDQLLAAGVDAELRIAGEGGERARLEALIARLQRQDRIRLLGYLPDPREFFETLDVFVLSWNPSLEGVDQEILWKFRGSSWRYVCTSPTHNPGKFDLWIEISADQQTLTIGNWKGVE